MNKQEDVTSVQISKRTKDRLNILKGHLSQTSQEGVIVKLIDYYAKNLKKPITI